MVAVIVALTSGLAEKVEAAKAPEWVYQPPDRPDLLQGVGVANETGSPEDDKLRADNNAFSEIVRQIRVTISSTLSSYYQEEGTETGGFTSSEVVSKMTESYAQETIEGITIADRYYDKKKGTYYAYAYISRRALEEQFRRKAEQAVRISRDYHRYAREALGAGNVYGALGHYMRALEELFVVQAYLKRKIEGDLEDDGREEMLQARLESELTSILAALDFEVVSGGGQHAQRNRGLESPLIGRVNYHGDAVLPVAGLPVNASFLNAVGEITGETMTGADGRFELFVSRVESASEEIGLIKAGIIIDELAPFKQEVGAIFKQVDRVGCTFEFTIDVISSIRIFVSIFEEVNGTEVPNPYANGSVIKSLVRNEFSVVDAASLTSGASRQEIGRMVRYGNDRGIVSAVGGDADYAIVGTITSVTSDSMAIGMGIVYSRADADIRVIDLDSGRVVASSSLAGVKGAGNNGRKANAKAIRGCADKVAVEILDGLKQALQ